MLGLCWPILGLCWLCSHLQAMLGLCSPILAMTFSVFTLQNPHDDAGDAPPPAQHNSHHLVALVASWTHVEAILPHLELCCLHDVTFIPKCCLKKLPPVACESQVWMLLLPRATLRSPRAWSAAAVGGLCVRQRLPHSTRNGATLLISQMLPDELAQGNHCCI